jgi:hypothetical protein
MFVTGDEASPLTAFLAIHDPQKDAGRIRQAVSSGFMVVTRADEETREARDNKTARRDAAFASGAQIVQTDFAAADPKIGNYRVSLENNPAAMCGAKLQSEHCVSFEGAQAPVRTASAATAL